MIDDVGRHLLAQVEEAAAELRAYPPSGVDWVARAEGVVRQLAPWLVASASGLKEHMERVLNAPARLKAEWRSIRDRIGLPAADAAAFERVLTDAGLLLEYVTGEVASSLVMRHLQAEYPGSDLRPNGKSDYPDLWLRGNDYSPLPKFQRAVKVYGAALKGRPPRPVRVPDGLEIKTCRDSIKVDCHHNHCGLHLAVVLSENLRAFTVVDVAVAFLKSTDYYRSERNTTATTEKFSFTGERFVSLLNRPNAPNGSSV